MNWISVKDRLPDRQQRVIAYGIWDHSDTNEHSIFIGQFYPDMDQLLIHNGKRSVQTVKNIFQSDDPYEYYDITHWIPLSEPPNE